jgi:hypothetical protein
MTQNTNSSAYTRLQPLINNDIGAIVSEHIRYYQKRKEDKEAKEKALKAQADALKLARNKTAIEAYEGLPPEDNEGFLQSQILEAFEGKKDYLWKLSERYADGDVQAGRELKDWERKFDNLANVNKVYGKKAQELALNEANYNEHLDKGVKGFTESTGKGLYTIDKETLGVNLYDPISKATRQLSNGELMSNSYLTSSYSGRSDFKGNGKALAQNLLDNEKGNKKENANTRLDGISLVKGLFADNQVETRSFYNYVRNNEVKDSKGNVVKFNDKDGNPIALGALQEKPLLQNKLAGLYYDNFIKPNLVETTPKPTGTSNTTPAVNKNIEKVNISADGDGNVILVADPNLPAPTGGATHPSDTEAYSVTDVNRKIGNQTQTLDTIYINKDGDISAQMSLYQPVTETSSTTVNGVTKEKTTSLGKFVKSDMLVGSDAMSAIGNLLGVYDEQGLKKLLAERKLFQQQRNNKGKKRVYKGVGDDGKPIYVWE